jgi:predicted ABC-type sugar transport system permease subunit
MQNATPMPDAYEARTRSFGQSAALFIGKYGALIVLALLFVVFSIIAPYFLTWANLVQIFNQAALVAIAACGLTLVLASNQFDLSLGNTASLAGIVVSVLMINGFPIPVAIAVAHSSSPALESTHSSRRSGLAAWSSASTTTSRAARRSHSEWWLRTSRSSRWERG